MTPVEIRARILELARVELHMPDELPEGDLSAVLDSVQRLTLVVAIEDHFKISFSPEEDQEVRSLADVVAAVAARLRDDPARADPRGDHAP